MKFPFKPAKLFHKHGGRITEITGIGHGIDKPREGRSRDYWHFVGSVEWRDGSKSRSIEIAPYSLCTEDDDKSELSPLLSALNDYLAEHGEWCGSEKKHEGWYAHERKIRRRA